VTTGNSWWVPAPSQPARPITTFLEEVADETNSPNALLLREIANRVKAKLQPGYAEIRRDAVVAIALFRDGKAAIGLQPIGSQTDLLEGCHRPLLPGDPSSLGSFYSQARCELLHDPSITNAIELIEIVRSFVLDGIKHEETTVPVDKRQCGGKVDVALVDKDGARLV
jgi:hypothetical protein